MEFAGYMSKVQQSDASLNNIRTTDPNSSSPTPDLVAESIDPGDRKCGDEQHIVEKNGLIVKKTVIANAENQNAEQLTMEHANTSMIHKLTVNQIVAAEQQQIIEEYTVGKEGI